MRDVATLRDRAAAVDRKLITITLETEVAFASASEVKAFAEELADKLVELAERYHKPKARSSRRYRFALGGHPELNQDGGARGGRAEGPRRPPPCRSKGEEEMTAGTDTRSHVTEIVLEAAPEKVWKALTDPKELPNWFPMEAAGTPGEGGTIRLTWDTLTMACPIKLWKPPQHLRIGWMEHLAPDKGASQMAVDYHLEARGGSTVLRVVHSGFGSGDDWDKSYDGTHRGWNQELRVLRLYLKRHWGKVRRLLWARAPVGGLDEAAWDRLMGCRGVERRLGRGAGRG